MLYSRRQFPGTNILKVLPLFIFSAGLESATHLLLKRGADRHATGSGIGYYVTLLKDKDVLLGIMLFGLESLFWVFILMRLPLSIAFPLTGLQKLLLVSFTVIVLRERLHPREWIGVASIAVGLIFITIAGN